LSKLQHFLAGFRRRFIEFASSTDKASCRWESDGDALDRAGGGKGIIDSQQAVGGWPELRSAPAPIDSDHDGMPDDWERKHGLDPNDPADGASVANGDGYTNLEDYLNSLTKD
jgi:hypothetical protein